MKRWIFPLLLIVVLAGAAQAALPPVLTLHLVPYLKTPPVIDGKLDDALRMAKKAVDLKPDNASYYDTLSRIYAAKGDLDGAVKSASKAVELEPHSKQLREQLESYRKNLGAGEKKK